MQIFLKSRRNGGVEHERRSLRRDRIPTPGLVHGGAHVALLQLRRAVALPRRHDEPRHVAGAALRRQELLAQRLAPAPTGGQLHLLRSRKRGIVSIFPRQNLPIIPPKNISIELMNFLF